MRLGPSHFRRGKVERYKDFEKPDLLDTLEAYGVVDLTLHEGARPYYNGPCPFHEAERNFTTFVVWPEIQRCACMSCHPAPMDSIDVWMRFTGKSFEETVKEICTPISQEKALQRMLSQANVEEALDGRFYAERLEALHERENFHAVWRLTTMVLRALNEGRPHLADSLLKRYER